MNTFTINITIIVISSEQQIYMLIGHEMNHKKVSMEVKVVWEGVCYQRDRKLIFGSISE